MAPPGRRPKSKIRNRETRTSQLIQLNQPNQLIQLNQPIQLNQLIQLGSS
jgi:hypothetical protein